MKLKLSEVALALWHTAGLAGLDTKESPEGMWDCESDIIRFFLIKPFSSTVLILKDFGRQLRDGGIVAS